MATSRKQKLVCGIEECKYITSTPQQMGRHKHREHGVLSANVTKRAKQIAKMNGEAWPGKLTKFIERAREQENHGNEKEIYAYTAGLVESIIHRVALEHDLPSRKFARGFIEYFSGAAGR